MAITTRLIGTLGGEPEVVTRQITSITSGSHSVSLPAGWGSAWCIFQGTARDIIVPARIFGRETEVAYNNTPVGGGILLTSGTTTIGTYLSGTLTQIRMT